MSPNPGRHRGAGLMVALFVILIFGLLTAALARLLTDSSENHAVEVQALRALMAAQTGIEYQLLAEFPLATASQPVVPSSSCRQPALSRDFATTTGLEGCRYDVSCQAVSAAVSTGVQTTLRLTSTGRCGHDSSGNGSDFAVSRTIVVEAFEGGNP